MHPLLNTITDQEDLLAFFLMLSMYTIYIYTARLRLLYIYPPLTHIFIHGSFTSVVYLSTNRSSVTRLRLHEKFSQSSKYFNDSFTFIKILLYTYCHDSFTFMTTVTMLFSSRIYFCIFSTNKCFFIHYITKFRYNYWFTVIHTPRWCTHIYFSFILLKVFP